MKFPRRKHNRQASTVTSPAPAGEVIAEAAADAADRTAPPLPRQRDPRTGRYVKRTAQ